MAKEATKRLSDSGNPVEQEFRKKNQWYAFTGALYGALGGASFIGLLGMVAQGVVAVAAGGSIGDYFKPIFEVAPLAIMGGLMAAGTFFVWMSQRQYTEQKLISDEHLALAQAKQQLQFLSPQKFHAVEHTQNSRNDGKKWSEVVRPGSQPAQQIQ